MTGRKTVAVKSEPSQDKRKNTSLQSQKYSLRIISKSFAACPSHAHAIEQEFPILACCPCLLVTSAMLYVAGYMWYVGLTFNTVTAILMVLAVGVAVDYSAHVAYSFLASKKATKTARAADALYIIGAEVFAGGFTTLLAAIALAFGTHYIMDVFFEMMAAIVVLGLWHGLVVLPVLLSIIGPAPFDDEPRQVEEEQNFQQETNNSKELAA